MRNTVRRAAAWAVAGMAMLAGCESTPDTPEARAKSAVATYKEGVALYNDGKGDQGIEKLREAKKSQPDYTLLRQDLGRMLLLRARVRDSESIRLALDAEQLRRDNKVALAQVKERESQEKHELAKQDFMEARDNLEYWYDAMPTDDERQNSSYLLSQAYTGLGDYERALDLIEEAIDKGKPTGVERDKFERARALLKDAALRQKRLGRG